VPALRAAMSMGARHIVFLSEELANTGGMVGELVELATACERRGIPIDAVGPGGDQDFKILRSWPGGHGSLTAGSDGLRLRPTRQRPGHDRS